MKDDGDMQVMISVLMGVYNGADTVARAVGSIFIQTYPVLECIVCDDGSTDDTYAELKACRERYGARLVVLRNEHNRGLAPTLNRCFSLAKGTYLARMDADDISAPQRLERQLAFSREHEDIAFVGCCARKFDQHDVYGEIVYPACPDKKDLLFNSCFVHPTVMMRRSVLTAAGGYSEADSRVRCEDYDLWLRLYAMGYRGANLQERLLDYYEGSQNLYKRKYRYRLNETVVRAVGFRANGMGLRCWPFVFKPLVVGILPPPLLRELKKRRCKRNGRT